MLTGRPTLRTPEGEQELRAWDVAFFPDGEAGAHKVTNNTDEDLRVAMLSNKCDPGAAVYPDSDKVGIFPPNKLFRLGDAVDYWDGEVGDGPGAVLTVERHARPSTEGVGDHVDAARAERCVDGVDRPADRARQPRRSSDTLRRRGTRAARA